MCKQLAIPATAKALATNFRLHCVPCGTERQRFTESVDIKHAEDVVFRLLLRNGTACDKCDEMYTLTYEVEQQEFPMAISWDYVMHCMVCGSEPMYVRSEGGKQHLVEAMGECLECGKRDWLAKPIPASQEVRVPVTDDDLPF